VIQEHAADVAAVERAVNYFKYFDQDLSGVINHEEFGRLHANLVQNHLTTLSYEDCLRELDEDGSGSVSISEYIDWLHRIGSLKKAE